MKASRATAGERGTITCPECGYQREEAIPADACVYFYEAHPTHSHRLHSWVITETRNVNAVTLGSVNQQLALIGFEIFTVQGERNTGYCLSWSCISHLDLQRIGQPHQLRSSLQTRVGNGELLT